MNSRFFDLDIKQTMALAFFAVFVIGVQAQSAPPLAGISRAPLSPHGNTVVPTTTIIASGLTEPLGVMQPPGDSSRLFVLQRTGQIRIVQGGAILGTAFLNLTVNVPAGGFTSAATEQGLLGLAFHPQYATNRQFFISYIDASGDSVVARYQAYNADPNVADPATHSKILRVYQPFANHNGGNLAFGPDGYLYIGFGDGGSGSDPNDCAEDLAPATPCVLISGFTGAGSNAQSPGLLGKMLRIDVNTTTPTGTAGFCGWDISSTIPYGVPSGNLRDRVDTACAEVWAYGLRNPWRWSFDRGNGDLWLADVGQGNWEEVNVVASGTANRLHFGWDSCEGVHLFEGGGVDCVTGSGFSLESGVSYLPPMLEYTSLAPPRCSVTGGFRYRGPDPNLQNTYFFGDYCTGELFCHTIETSGFSPCVDSSLVPIEVSNFGLSSFGEDNLGNVYVTDLAAGSLIRLGAVPVDAIFGHGFENP